MSYFAPNAYLIYNFIYLIYECLVKIFHFFTVYKISNIDTFVLVLNSSSIILYDNKFNKISSNKRIGPHNKDILDILFGSLLGDCQAEFRNKGNGTRFCFYQESSHSSYIEWLHSIISDLGYTSTKKPIIQTRLGKKGNVRKVIRFKTWTYSSFN